MRRVRYGVAASLDGYIAGPNGEYDWIPMDPDIDFAAMMAEFDAWLMGRRTYELVVGAGGAGGFRGDVFVFSRTLSQEDHPGVTIVAQDAKERLSELRKRQGKDIALYGGGELFRSLLELGEVDTVEVAVVPVLLGGGIPLLPSPAPTHRLELTAHTIYGKTGTALLRYAVRPDRKRGRRPQSPRGRSRVG